MTVLHPKNDRLIVHPVEREKISKGGIIIPDTVQDRPVKGEVVAVGPGLRNPDGTRQSMDVVVGDIVYYGKFAGTEFTVDGKTHLLIREIDVICSVVETDTPPAGALNFSNIEAVSVERALDE